MEKNESKKAYMFYVSDYHFEMIGLLNINKEIKENKKVVILTENNLQESVETVLSKTNLKEEEKNKIKQINWTNENKEKEIEGAISKALDELEKEDGKGQKLSIYIKGKEEFIKEQNEKINKLIQEKNSEKAYENISITDCYNFMEIADKSKDIIKKYEENVNTEGKKQVNI